MRVLALILTLACALPAQGACRLALSLGLDVSGSVDETEYALQMNGLASALLNPEVQDALLSFPGAPVRLHVFKWAGYDNQGIVLRWVEIDSPERIAEIADLLRHSPRTPMSPATGIGAALRFGAAALAQQPGCDRRTLDLSGDGISNSGTRPRDVATPGITVNGLVIGSAPRNAEDSRDAGTGQLAAYYRAEVIRGPDPFVEVAAGFADFEAAMTRKLLKELTHLVLSRHARD